MQLIILLVCNFSFSQEKEKLYLLHVVGKIDTCQFSPYRDGRNKKLAKFKHSYQMGSFVFGGLFFLLKKDSKITEINEDEFKKIKFGDINHFMRKMEIPKNQLLNSNTLFDIYIVISTFNGKYLILEAQWKEVYIDCDSCHFNYLN